ncbi:hypothetical protein SprV_0401519800 [Sparganum proliferum]
MGRKTDMEDDRNAGATVQHFALNYRQNVFSFKESPPMASPVHNFPPKHASFLNRNLQTKNSLLCAHCIVFGIEVGFKFATSSFIWILNPCHLLTVIQIWLLLADPSEVVTGVFRIHLHMLNGPLLALLFPVVNTRILPFETAVYYLQHLLILLIPALLIDQRSAYSVEPLLDFSWVIFALSLQVLYHFLVLQPVSVITLVNLNNMLCPAVSDPFAGPYYRVMAMIHQPLLILILGKVFACLVFKLKGSPASKLEFSSRRTAVLFTRDTSYAAVDFVGSK